MQSDILRKIRSGLVVSCQAYEGDPLFGHEIMAKLAIAAEKGGASAIRANSPIDIKTIKQSTPLPVIGIWKMSYSDSPVYITPTYKEIEAVALAGADMIAIDATTRIRPNGELLSHLLMKAKLNFPHCLFMADVSTIEEGIEAEKLGFDCVSTTLSGYTPYSTQQCGPDLQLIKELSEILTIPILAEGRIQTPEEAKFCLQNGAYAVVVGAAITRPEVITQRFVDEISLAHV